MKTEDELFELLTGLGITTWTVHHPPVFTVEESRRLRGELPGGHCKSLFLRDKKRTLWLVVAREDQRIDLKALRPVLGAVHGLSFGSPELMEDVLGVSPGAVTPFAAINDDARRVEVVLDEKMLALDPLNYHPLRNDRTTAISAPGLLRFLRATGHEPKIIDLDAVR